MTPFSSVSIVGFEQVKVSRVLWMIHSNFNNNRGKNVHEKYLQLLYNDKTSSYEELQYKEVLVSIHHGVFQVDCESAIAILST